MSSTGQNEVQGCVGLLEQCKHRYLAFLAGTTYSSRIKYQLLCGSLVLAQEPRFLEWWSRLLAPGVHYVPVEKSWANVQPLMQLLRQKPPPGRPDRASRAAACDGGAVPNVCGLLLVDAAGLKRPSATSSLRALELECPATRGRLTSARRCRALFPA